MTPSGILYIAVYFLVLLALTKPWASSWPASSRASELFSTLSCDPWNGSFTGYAVSVKPPNSAGRNMPGQFSLSAW